MNSTAELLKDTAVHLEKIISEAIQNFAHISENEWRYRRGSDKWSRKEILGHLMDSAVNNHLRFVRAQLAEKEFVSFTYEQNFYVSTQNYQDYETKKLIDVWYNYNSLLAHVIRNVDPSKLNIICKIGNYEPAPLSFIITDYVEHMKHHLNRITEKTLS